MTQAKIEFQCPKCGASTEVCSKDCERRRGTCPGFVCECDDYDSGPHRGPDHGESFANACSCACCGCCGWSGTFPQKPKGLQAWEKKALEAGWCPPDLRAKELGMKGGDS